MGNATSRLGHGILTLCKAELSPGSQNGRTGERDVRAMLKLEKVDMQEIS